MLYVLKSKTLDTSFLIKLATMEGARSGTERKGFGFHNHQPGVLGWGFQKGERP